MADGTGDVHRVAGRRQRGTTIEGFFGMEDEQRTRIAGKDTDNTHISLPSSPLWCSPLPLLCEPAASLSTAARMHD